MKTKLEPSNEPMREENDAPLVLDHHLTTQLTALQDRAQQDGNIGGD